MKELTTTQISELLNINKDSLRSFGKQKIETKLLKKGYKLIAKVKKGRQVYYQIEKISNNTKIDEYHQLCTKEYKTRVSDKFGKYFDARTKSYNEEVTEDLPKNTLELAEHVGVAQKTICKWDNTLLDKDILRKDAFYYLRLDVVSGEITICSAEEYKSFWKNKSYMSAFEKLQKRYIKGEITLTELQLATAEIASVKTVVDGCYYYRINKYETNTENPLYQRTIKLLQNNKIVEGTVLKEG